MPLRCSVEGERLQLEPHLHIATGVTHMSTHGISAGTVLNCKRSTKIRLYENLVCTRVSSIISVERGSKLLCIYADTSILRFQGLPAQRLMIIDFAITIGAAHGLLFVGLEVISFQLGHVLVVDCGTSSSQASGGDGRSVVVRWEVCCSHPTLAIAIQCVPCIITGPRPI